MVERPWQAVRRLPPDPVQLQVILGSLFGDGQIVGAAGARRLRIAHGRERAEYVRWKYERLGTLAAEPPHRRNGVLEFETIAHPLFDDLARVFCPFPQTNRKRPRPHAALALLGPLGLAVWMTDVGRLELRADAFLPAQRALALAN